MKRFRTIAGTVVCLLIVASVVASLLQPSSLEAARAQCVERGYKAENLMLKSLRDSGIFWGRTASLQFQVKDSNPPKAVVIEMQQALYFLPWQVVSFQEKAQQ
jgi:hypothetical protein